RPVRFWLLRIATNEAISHARRRGREMRRRADEDAAGMLPDPSLAPDALSIAREDQARIRAAVAALPELYRVVVVLRYFNELDVAAIVARAEDRPLGLASLASSLFAGLATAALLAVGAMTIWSLAPAVAADTFAAAISLVALVAVSLDPAVRTLQQPTIPIAA